ncbi:MAG: hypothetical protein K9I94_06585 [Bacteroidales bacterium]|nr:hypothetical protein [Bacteroidales bacterium]
MKRFLSYTGLILVFLIAIAFGAFWYAGIFTSFSVTEIEVGPYTGLYENVYGDHSDASEVRNKIYKELNGDKLTVSSVFGVYFEEPESTPKGDLMGYAGCMIAHSDTVHLDDLRYPYETLRMKRNKRIVVDIRYENNLTQLAGMLRIHPAMREYAEIKGYQVKPIMEIYDLPNQRIRYIMPLGEANQAKVFK